LNALPAVADKAALQFSMLVTVIRRLQRLLHPARITAAAQPLVPATSSDQPLDLTNVPAQVLQLYQSTTLIQVIDTKLNFHIKIFINCL
jgi:hypothetical protein